MERFPRQVHPNHGGVGRAVDVQGQAQRLRRGHPHHRLRARPGAWAGEVGAGGGADEQTEAQQGAAGGGSHGVFSGKGR
jgi:hypothetical protein